MLRVNAVVSLQPDEKPEIDLHPSEIFTITEIYGNLCTIKNEHRVIINVPLRYWREVPPKVK